MEGVVNMILGVFACGSCNNYAVSAPRVWEGASFTCSDWELVAVLQSPTLNRFSLSELGCLVLEFTYRLHYSSFLWLAFRILEGNPKKELRWSLWVRAYGINDSVC